MLNEATYHGAKAEAARVEVKTTFLGLEASTSLPNTYERTRTRMTVCALQHILLFKMKKTFGLRRIPQMVAVTAAIGRDDVIETRA